MTKKLLLMACLAALGTSPARAQFELVVDFDHPPGRYTEQMLEADWPNLQWSDLDRRATIIDDAHRPGNRVLRVSYPKGSVGAEEGGGQFLVDLPPADEYYCDYRVRFEPGFDFRLGGKLPGLTGGKSNTGGHRTTGDGWSARYMWRREGAAVVYLYHLDQRSKYGDDLPLGVSFQPGRWYRLTQHVRVNSPGQRDGILEVWVDGKQVLSRHDLRYRNGTQAPVDHFYFSTFHGGDGKEWAPKTDSFAQFDQFRITTTPPEFNALSPLQSRDRNGAE